MSFSYDDTDLNTTTASGRLNSTRLLLGDTNSLEPQVQDSEVVFSLAQNSDNVYLSAAWLARVVSMKYAREVDIDLDGILSVSNSQLSKAYSDLAEDLEYQAKVTGVNLGVSAGGLPSTGTSNSLFKIGQFWNPPKGEEETISYEG